ncbi:MAG: hypothetical protein HY817_03555 [Candidatus Abawacabacteria bacterium]|nr:hypothetical protein [Candidatus Abawacabacteria bacterium]
MKNGQLQKIREQSKSVDTFWEGITAGCPENFSIHYPIPRDHIRFKSCQSYLLCCRSIQATDFTVNDLIIIDEYLLAIPWLQSVLSSPQNIIPLAADETKTKEIHFLNSLLAKIQKKPRIIGIGGGITTECSRLLSRKIEYRSHLCSHHPHLYVGQ